MKLLKELIKAGSYDGNYAKIEKAIVSSLKDMCGKVILQKVGVNKNNIIAIFGKPTTLINCHMDTVVPSGKWTKDPLSVTIKDKKIYGLGTTDTKGNIYAVLKACKEVKKKNVMLLFTVDEEGDGVPGSHYFVSSKYAKGINKAIVCEPTGLKEIWNHKGYYSFDVTVPGKAMHSSVKGNGESKNAIIKAAELALKLDRAGFTIGSIGGGKAGNIMPESVSMKASLRKYDSHEAVKKTIMNICKGCMVRVGFVGIPLINKKMKDEVNYWSEAANFSSAGISACLFGVGNIKNAHTADEYVLKKDLKNAISKFKSILEMTS